MKSNLRLFSSLLAGSFAVFSLPSMANITFEKNQFEVVSAPSCNHVPIVIPFTSDNANFDSSSLIVSSDSNWATPTVNTEKNQIEVAFSTEDLFASYSATLSVNDGTKVVELFVDLTMPAMDIYRLVDDPIRSKTYGILKNGTEAGSIIAFDPVEEKLLSCVTVGDNPTDFEINDDASELVVINSVSQSIDFIDLQSFTVKETLKLPDYTAWGDAEDTAGNVAYGPNDIIYYTDGAWAPVLYTFDRKKTTSLR